jgi:hypothetical protein
MLRETEVFIQQKVTVCEVGIRLDLSVTKVNILMDIGIFRNLTKYVKNWWLPISNVTYFGTIFVSAESEHQCQWRYKHC